MKAVNQAPFKKANFMPRDLEITKRDDGSILMKTRVPLKVREQHFPAYLRRHAKIRPSAPWIAQRRPPNGDWKIVEYGEARRIVDNLAQALLNLELPSGAPLVILSGNSIEQALISIAAMQAHIPVAPISTAYALQSADYVKLNQMIAMVKPGAIFVQNGNTYKPALQALGLGELPVVAAEAPLKEQLLFADLAATPAGEDVERAFATLDPHSTAKLMFTSGSTGSPKAVMQSHYNISAAAESILLGFGDTEEGEMVRLDWTPWSHVFGATGLAMSLIAGGVIYIDDGRPGGALFKETLRNLREVSPTTYASVPAGYAALVDALERDDELAERFFAKLKALGYAGARLPDDVAARMQVLAVKHTGCRLSFTSGYGSTETCPAGAAVYWETARVGLIGLPQSGYEFKLVPIDRDRYEVRIRGHVTDGYYGRADLNAQIFDEEGYYRMGDACSFVDKNDPLQGLMFAGRLSEEFKLQTGTFVLVGSLRSTLVDAAAPMLSDVVVCGENQAYVAIMAWLNLDVARSIAGKPDATLADLNRDSAVRKRVAEALAAHNARNPGTSTRVLRFHLLDEPPSIDSGEITDKGSINQRGVQTLREDLVQALFAASPGADVVDVAAAAGGGVQASA